MLLCAGQVEKQESNRLLHVLDPHVNVASVYSSAIDNVFI